MKRIAKWGCWIVGTSFMPLLGLNCATGLRDAAVGGILDFVSGTTTDVLSAVFPVAETLGG